MGGLLQRLKSNLALVIVYKVCTNKFIVSTVIGFIYSAIAYRYVCGSTIAHAVCCTYFTEHIACASSGRTHSVQYVRVEHPFACSRTVSDFCSLRF